MDLDDLPKNKKSNFPMGVSEHEYATKDEMDAFITGVNLPDDMDVSVGEPFLRESMWVIRVRVGSWGDD